MFSFTLVAPATALADLVFNHSLRSITEFHLRNRIFLWVNLSFFSPKKVTFEDQCQNKPSWCSPFPQLLLHFTSFLLTLPTLPIRSCIYSHFSDLLSHYKNALKQQFMFLAARPCNIKTQRSVWLGAITVSQACAKQYTKRVLQSSAWATRCQCYPEKILCIWM